MTHAFPDQHGHLAVAAPVGTVEMIPDETDQPGRAAARPPAADRGGRARPLRRARPRRAADWDAIERHAHHDALVDRSEREG